MTTRRGWERGTTFVGVALALALTGGVDRKAAKLNNEANRLYDEQKFEEADKLYEEAETRDPEAGEIYYNRGNALYRQQKHAEAVTQLRRGAETSTDPVVRQRSYYNLGNALHGAGKLQEAAGAYRRALALDPHDRDAKINYEKTLLEMQQQKQEQQKQQQQGGQKSDDEQQQGGQGDEQQQQQPSQDSQGQGEQQQQPEPQSGEPKPGEPSAEDQKDPRELPAQPVAIDSLAEGDLSPEEANRILEAMREQEKELQKERARQKARTRKVEKDW